MQNNFNEVTDYVIYRAVDGDGHIERWTWSDMRFLALESKPWKATFRLLDDHNINYTYSYRVEKIGKYCFPEMFVCVSFDKENEALMLLVVEETMCRLEDVFDANR